LTDKIKTGKINMVKIGDIELGEFPLLLAPMEDVSDPPFRAVCKLNGADLMYSEFISSEGLIRDAIKSRKKLDIFDYERPVGIQIFGGDEEPLAMAAQIVEAANPDLLDINFGCPVKKVICKGAGAGILKDIPKMVKLTEAVVKATKLPVTVKTRLGWDDDTKNIEEVAQRLQDVGIQALTVHGRTRTQMYKGSADWTLIGKVKNNPKIRIPIFGNGDICTPEQAKNAREKYGVDGVMIGRAAIGYPWIFNEVKHFLATGKHLPPPTVEERVKVCKQHLRHSISWKGEIVGILEMRRHYTNYLKGLPHIKEFRAQLVTCNTASAIEAVLDAVALQYKDHIFERTMAPMAGSEGTALQTERELACGIAD
jgi:nifR3 family TIM-barrel protein